MFIQHYFELIQHYRKMLLAVVVVVVVATLLLSIATLVIIPKYTSTASVMLMPHEAELSYTKKWAEGSSLSPASILTQTHLEYLMSRPVMIDVLLEMKAQLGGGAPQEGIKVIFQKVARWFISTLWKIYTFLNYGKITTISPMESEISRLMRNTELETIEGSYILNIGVSLGNPEAAAAAANAFVKAYAQRVSDQAAKTSKILRDFILEEVRVREGSLEKLYLEDASLRRELNIESLETEKIFLLTAIETERAKLIEEYSKLAEHEVRLQSLDQNLGKGNRPNIQAEVDKEVIFGRVDREGLQKRITRRESTVSNYRDALNKLGQKETLVTALERDKNRINNELVDLRQRILDVDLSFAESISRVRTINPAQVPVFPSSPKVLVYTFTALVAGIFLSLFILVVVDTVSGTVKTSIDLRRFVGDRALGAVSWQLLDHVTGRKIPGILLASVRKELDMLGSCLINHEGCLSAASSNKVNITGIGDQATLAEGVATLASGIATASEGVACVLPRDNSTTGIKSILSSRKIQIADDAAAYEPGQGLLLNYTGVLSVAELDHGDQYIEGALLYLVAAGAVQEDTLSRIADKHPSACFMLLHS